MDIYDSSVPVLTGALANLANVLKKGAAHAKHKGIDESVFLNARLAPDMFSLTRQVQVATDMATRGMDRLGGGEPVSTPDTETTFKALQARVSAAQKKIKAYKRADLEGADSRIISMQLPIGKLELNGLELINMWIVPNVYFHCVAVYNILRHNGVELTKADFLGEGLAKRMSKGKQPAVAKKSAAKRAAKR